jgi:hypothetical protein
MLSLLCLLYDKALSLRERDGAKRQGEGRLEHGLSHSSPLLRPPSPGGRGPRPVTRSATVYLVAAQSR